MPDTSLPMATDGRGPDGGPLYAETPSDLANFQGLIAEPWNGVTASLFVVIALVWFIRLWGRFRQYPFLTICIPLLFVGGVGGMLFHGLRVHRIFLLMDIGPIYILGVIVTLYLWFRLGPRIWHVLGMVVLMSLFQLLGHWKLPTHWAINVSYGCLAALILIPLGIVLLRTRFIHAGWVYTAITLFTFAWFCRITDTWRPPVLPMGTHWLWHTFGALTTAALSEYIYRIEGVKIRLSSEQ